MRRPVTIATNQGAIGGGEVMLLAVAEAARALGREVTVVGPRRPSDLLDAAADRGFSTVPIEADSPRDYLVGLRRWDRRERRGLLWCNGLRPAAATSGHPDRIVHVHQLPVGRHRVLAAVARHRSAATVVPSQMMADRLRGAEVLSNWVAAPPKPRSVAPAATVTVGFLGRLSEAKGVPVLCAAMSVLQQRRPGAFRLLLAGESRFVDRAQVDRVDAAIAGVPGACRRGWTDRTEFFNAVDVAVFPSVWPETFGLVVAEAMAARCRFVISDAGALPEVAGPEHPWVARAGDPLALADAIEAAATGDQLPVDQAFARWRTHFSPEVGTAAVGRLLDRLEGAPQ